MKNEADWQPTKFELGPGGLWRSSRKNVPHRSRLIADRIAAVYSKAIKENARGRLADLGCGSVPLYAIYRPQVQSVTCVDWPGSVHATSHVDLFADLNEPLALEDGQYDTVIASDVIEHLHTPLALFSSAARALKPGGSLIVGVPFLYWVHEAPHDYHRYTRFALTRLCEQANLQVAAIEPYGGAPEVIADLMTKTLGGRAMAAKLIYYTTKAMLSLPPVKRISRTSSANMPWGYLLIAKKPLVDDIPVNTAPAMV